MKINQYPGCRDWYNILPYEIARSQTAFDRMELALRARAAGLSLSKIGVKLNITRSRVDQILNKADRLKAKGIYKAPVLNYFDQHTVDLEFLSSPKSPEAKVRSTRALKQWASRSGKSYTPY
jgi:hypothetical protein